MRSALRESRTVLFWAAAHDHGRLIADAIHTGESRREKRIYDFEALARMGD